MSIAVIDSPQRSPAVGGTALIALKNEGGVVNVILYPEVFAMYRLEIHSVCTGLFVAADLAV
jgi:hypothetical protein